MPRLLTNTTWMGLLAILVGLALAAAAPQTRHAERSGPAKDTLGVVGDGQTDDTAAIQRAIDAQRGRIELPRGVYRITKPIVVDLDKVGYTSIVGHGVASLLMAGPGPALRFVGTHRGTAAPRTVQENVWARQRTPLVDGLEIVGAHPQACGIEASGTMQLTLTRVVVRQARHAIHLVERNRNVILSECHLYDNQGIGVFLDRLNLHQINISNCHISYNDGGGVVARRSEIRNLQIGTCDIEGNMGGPDSEPTANVLLDASQSSLGEVAIVGCTIQHSHDAPKSANIRIDGRSTKRSFTDELRHGNITIADNVLSDVQLNVEVRNARGVSITGNTMWKGYTGNLLIAGCANVVVANNVFDRNPRYHYSDGSQAKLGLVFVDSTGCTINGNHLHGVGDVAAAIQIRRCQQMNIANCTILNYSRCGLLLADVTNSRVSDCLIRTTASTAESVPLSVERGEGNMVVDNLLSAAPRISGGAAITKDNVYPQ